MSELFVVDKKGRKREVILDLKRYKLLKGMESVIDLQELLQAAKEMVEKEPVDSDSLSELLKDIEDLVEVARRHSEETIPWEKAKKSLTK